MDRNGTPFIPRASHCPSEHGLSRFAVNPEMFSFAIADGVVDGKSPFPQTDVAGMFFPELGWETGRFVTTDMLAVPRHSDLAEIAREIEASGARQQLEIYAGELLCDRIKYCRGFIEGECWALGKRALSKTLLDLSRERRYQ